MKITFQDTSDKCHIGISSCCYQLSNKQHGELGAPCGAIRSTTVPKNWRDGAYKT